MASNFWTDSQLQPKRAFRYLLDFDPVGQQSLQYLAKSVTKPTFELSSTPHQYLNHTFYYPGRVTWQPITVTLIDTTQQGMNVSEAIMRVLDKSGYRQPAQNDNRTISKSQAVASGLSQIQIKVIDSKGDVVETWSLKNAFIQRAEFGNLDYASEEVTNVTLTIQYDYAFIDVVNPNGGPSQIPGIGDAGPEQNI